MVDDHDAADSRLPASPETIVVYSDLNCSFAHVAVHRIHQARRRLGLFDQIWIDHRAFPLELFNEEVNARPGVDSEIAVLGGLEPAAGWRMWQGPDWTYPVTTLPALEAVQAAKAQGWQASEQLDLGLRKAFWAHGRCISQRHVILDVARLTGCVDVTALAADLDNGRARAMVMNQFRVARDHEVVCSPHVFLSDGTNVANPGIEAHWSNGSFGIGYPVIDSDHPVAVEELLRAAAGQARVDVARL